MTPQSHAGFSLASSHRNLTTANHKTNSGSIKNNLIATAPHNKNYSESRYSAMNTDGGLTYSASAFSEVSEYQEDTIRPDSHFINIEQT